MMATTIMSSIKVNPERRFVFFMKESPARNVRLMRCLILQDLKPPGAPKIMLQ
jgi:hypothetical protein